MPSPLHVDVNAVRKEAVRVAEKQFKAARTTLKRHEARRALAKARRAVEGSINGSTQT